MQTKMLVKTGYLLYLMCLLMCLGVGCAPASDSSGSRNSNAAPSSILFSVKWDTEGFQNADKRSAHALDCDDSGVFAVQAIVYDLDYNTLKEGPDWNCSDRSGTLEEVPSGSDARVVLIGKDAFGQLIYRGESGTVTLPPGQTVYAGTINALYFAPALTSPLDNAIVDIGKFKFNWDAVDGAAEYRLIVSQNSDLSDPVIDQIVEDTSFRSDDLNVSSDYYWQAQARDISGNEGIASETRRFSTSDSIIIPSGPIPIIISPADNSHFEYNQSIDFEGYATDDQDVQLTDAVLTWVSSIDGQIGTGESFSISSLSVGNHQITLTATDSDSRTGSTGITISIESATANTAPTVEITYPNPNDQFTQGQTIEFTGTATDPEEGALDTSAMVWESSIDGKIQSSTTLSAGNHTITLTATDGQGLSASTSIEITVNGTTADTIPVVTITTPVNNQYFHEFTSISFQGEATDAEDGPLPMTWKSSIDGIFTPPKMLSIGRHTITLSATDSAGQTGTHSITVTILEDNAPVVKITAPKDNDQFAENTQIEFQGTATDLEDGILPMTWTSSIDGEFESPVTLSPGSHKITLSADDSAGHSERDYITVTILADNAPVVTITAPEDNLQFNENTSISLEGSAIDPEDGNLPLNWFSSLDGAIPSTTALSIGTHTITLSATDSHGHTGTDTITLTVVGNTAPYATITSPATGSYFGEGTNITFTGTGTDAEDGSASLTWTSSIEEGPIGTGSTFSTSQLSSGTHDITLTAADSEGLTDTDTISIVVVQYANQSPTAVISTPTPDQTYQKSPGVTLTGSGSDPEDGTLSGGSLVWTSDVLGDLGTGTAISLDFPYGDHAITLTVTDNEGLTDTQEVLIHVSYSGMVITGDWDYTNTLQWVEGLCAPGSGMSGICRIRQSGLNFTLEFISGTTCDPKSLCFYTGTIDYQSDEPYQASNSAKLDDGGVATNTISLGGSLYSLIGSGDSEYTNDQSNFYCQWRYNISLSRGPQ